MQIVDINKYYILVEKQSEYVRLNPERQEYNSTGLYFISGTDELGHPLYKLMNEDRISLAISEVEEVLEVLKQAKGANGKETTKLH